MIVAHWIRRVFVVVGVSALGVSLLAAPSAGAKSFAQEVSDIDKKAGELVRAVEPLLAPAREIVGSLPADPTQALIDRTEALSAAVGFPQDATLAVTAADLSEDVAGRLANVVRDLLDCHNVTARHFAELGDRLEEIARDGGGIDPARFADIRACADALSASTTELELTLGPAGSASRAATLDASCSPFGTQSIDLWPVLRLDGACGDTVYLNDYLLQIDLGGNDTYMNNAGSNVVDVNFSPAGSAVVGVRGVGPARGCQRAIPGLTAADCIPTAAVLLDTAGNDIYGVKQTPDHDTGCTNDLLIRRMVTGGVGFIGVGILRDSGGSQDKYTGKTVSLGAGHVGGVGILSDNGGNDTYSSVRNSQGFALVTGVGILHDAAGNDKYDFYLPSPIDPTAPNQTEGAGGVRDDEGEGLCDNVPRFVQGAGNVLPGTIGILLDDGGMDVYHGVFAGSFTAPAQVPSTKAGSLGFGNNQGTGIFADRGGDTDKYTVDNEPEPRRGNNRIIPPGNPSTSEGGGQGIFIDR